MSGLFQYVKGKGRFKNCNVGAMYAIKRDDTIFVVTCKANVSAGDVFTKEMANTILGGRMDVLVVTKSISVIPKSMRKDVEWFIRNRCIPYFKTGNINPIEYKG
jgi:hypothetical protein